MVKNLISEQQNTELESLFRFATMGIVVVNSKGEIVRMNPCAERIFGYETKELLGKKIEQLIPAKYARAHVRHRTHFNRHPQPRVMGTQTDIFGLRKDGSEFPAEISLSPFSTPKGNFIIAFVVDITQRKLAESLIAEKGKELQKINRALQEKNSSLEKMNKELETFTFISSHDLQEPLRKIKNFVGVLLAEDYKKMPAAEIKNYLKRTYETANRMQQLIEDLLAYSRVKNAERKFVRTNLNRIIKEALVDFRENILEKEAMVKVRGWCVAKIIRFQFGQLMHNLLSNSLKFKHPERKLRITITCETRPGAKFKQAGLSPDKRYCRLTFADNGIGFEPQYSERIFEVFERLHTTEKYRGTGIGLAICKRIVENHSGVITASGRLNKGARFDIYIPL